jgi:integrase
MRRRNQKNRTRIGPHLRQSRTAESQVISVAKIDYVRRSELDAKSGVTGWRLHDLRRTCVSGMAALGVAPHVADKILNHQSGTISGVAAVYQRHQFMSERKAALEKWGAHVAQILSLALAEERWGLGRVA